MASIDGISELLQTSATVAGPASEQMIQDAETALAVRFPPSYRRFLASFGAALCPTHEIAGLFEGPDNDEPPLFTDVVATTLQVRRALRGEIPQDYVAISDDGGDYTYYLDTGSGRADGECPVIALGPGVHSVEIAEDFPDFVARIFGDRIDFQPG